MKILIVTQYFWPESFRINDLALGLVEKGHEVIVLTGKPNYPQGNYFKSYRFFNKSTEWFGPIKIIRSPLIPRGKSKLTLALNYISFVLFASLIGLCRCPKADVIFVFEPSPITVGLPAILLKKIRKIPILFWVQDLWPESVLAVNAIQAKPLLNLLNKMVRFIYCHCDYILTTSKAYFDSIKKQGVQDNKLYYFPQTCESLYQPLAASSDFALKHQLPSGFKVMFSGNLGIAQDISNIIEAAKLLKHHIEIKWLFVGDGSKRQWLLEEIKQHQLEKTVYWLGQHPTESMPTFFAQADALLMTLKPDPIFKLTVPGKLQSYLACAKPIIAAVDGEGNKIIEEAGAGLTVPSGNPIALAQAVLRLHQTDNKTKMTMGHQGKLYFDQHFNREILLNQLEAWMQDAKESYQT